MAGIGKTTLAQLIYKDSSVQQHFNLKVWVTISEEFNVLQITKRIYKEVTSQECETGEPFVLQSKLNEAVEGKRFLFVLDDVWNESRQLWNNLKSAFKHGGRGSKIIVTTRSKQVASTMGNVAMHELQLVSDEDCWHIFAKDVFDDVDFDAHSELKTIGMEIVKKCKGLPLAVKSMAGVLHSVSDLQDMRSTLQEWRKIQADDIWKLQFQENQHSKVLPALWLSYHFLPPALKRCFAYCSIFPKDYEFEQSDMEKIIWLWMAEGLLTPEKGRGIEDVGEAYLKALISRSFFQRSSRRESAMVMHDLVHDLAMFISGEFCFSCSDSNDLSNLGTKSYHLSYKKASDDLMKLGAVSQSREKKLTSLRTLLALPLSYECVLYGPISLHELFLKVGGCLRVLALSESSITELPDSIGNMKYVRYLDLSGTSIKELPDSICTFYNLQTLLLSQCEDLERLPTRLAALVNLRHLDIRSKSLKELPDSICTLYHLQTLLLSDCKQLTQLPTRLAALVNLRHLDIRGTSLEKMPPQMCKMKSLERLSDFVLGDNDCGRIKELGELPLLGGSLRISGLQHIVDVKDVSEANLKDKKFLSELILEWGGDFNITSSQQEKEVLEAFQPHTNLKQLRIKGYKDTIFPDWVGHESFCNMVQVDLHFCTNVLMLPPLGQLSSLRRLVILGTGKLVRIGNELCGSSSTTTNHPFTSLEYLQIKYMASWEEWSFSSDRLGQEGGVFPSLTDLHINVCKKLIVGLPDCHLPSLKSIHIEKCDEMVGVFVCQSRQEMDTNAFPSLRSISIDRCKKLWENRMKWGLERLPSLMTLSLVGMGREEEVDSFPEEGLLPTTLTHLCILHFSKLKGLNGRAFQHLTSLQNLRMWYCRELECLPQEGLPLSLSRLSISGCPVLEQRCQRGTGEDWPKIQHIPKIIINYEAI
ncbi:hypothetical protein UlMin_004010 [Ulmus minor]